jgi:hypothetical protein
MTDGAKNGMHVITVRDWPVEFEFDQDLGTWHFHVDNLRITGGGQRTLDEARDAAAEAIDIALQE